MRTPIPRDAEGLPCQRRPDLFLIDDSNTQRVAAAKFHCATCPLLLRCADWGLHHEKHLVWGGMSPEERDAIREARGIVLKTPSLWISRAEYGGAA